MQIARLLLVALMACLGAWRPAAAQVPTTPKVEITLPVAHSGWPEAMAFLPDGRFLLAAGPDSNTKLWDLQTGELVRTYGQHAGPMSALAVAPSGTFFVSGGEDGIARVFDIASGDLLAAFSSGPVPDDLTANPIRTIAISDDGARIAYGTLSGAVWVADIGDGDPPRHTQLYAGVPLALKFDPAENAVVVVNSDGAVWFFEPATLDQTKRPIVVDASGLSVAAVVPGDRTEVVFGRRGTPLGIVDYRTRATTRVKMEDQNNDWLVISPDGKQVLTDDDIYGLAVIRDLGTGAEVNRLDLGHTGARKAFSPDGKTIANASGNGFAIVDTRSGAIVSAPVRKNLKGWNTSVSSDGEIALNSSSEGMRLWSPATGATVRQFPGEAKADAWLSPDASKIVSCGNGAPVRVRDARSGEILAEFPSPTYEMDVLFSLTRGLALLRSDTGVSVLNLNTLAPPLPIPDLPDPQRVALSPDGRTMAVSVAGDPDQSSIRAVSSGKILHMLEKIYSYPAFAFSPDGSRLVGSDLHGDVVVWDARSGKVRMTASVDAASLFDGFSPDGRFVYSVTTDWNLTIWNLKTGERAWTFGNESMPRAVLFSEDGKRVTIEMLNGVTRVRDLKSGETLLDRVVLADGSVVSMTPEGFYDGAGATNFVRLVRGLDVYNVAPVDAQLNRPDLVAAKLAGDPGGRVAAAAASLDLRSFLQSAIPIASAPR